MSFADDEQVRHDRVNLMRLVRRLEQTVSSHQWEEEIGKPTRATWIKTQGMLQKVKYARKLLKTVELHHALEDMSTSTRLEEYEETIDKLEQTVAEANKRVKPEHRRPPPILPTLPAPVISITQPVGMDPASAITADLPLDGLQSPSLPQPSLLSSKDAAVPAIRPPIDPTASLIPATPTTSTDKSSTVLAGTPAFLQNSAALQEEMTAQLAEMAVQLRRNAQHFASSLDKDKYVVDDFQEKLQRNHDVMTKERVRLRDHRGKSWGTTGILILSLVVVIAGFIMTFFVIRIT